MPVIKETDCGLWPTPTKCGNHNRKGVSESSGDGLATAVQQWPTPRSSQRGDCKSKRERNTPDLCSAVKIYPTPNASDNRDRGGPQTPSVQKRIKKGKQIGLTMHFDGNLNPDWVEWLMSWPVGWSSLKPLKELVWLNPSIDPHPEPPRVTTLKDNRTNRLKAIGNGQYPPCVAEAWHILN